MKILEFIDKNIGTSLAPLLMKLFNVFQKAMDFLLAWQKDKKDKQLKKEQKQKEDKIDDVVSHGTIEDLLDLGRQETGK